MFALQFHAEFGTVFWNLYLDKIEKHLLNTYWVQSIMQITINL